MPRRRAASTEPKRNVDVVARPCHGLPQLCCCLFEAVDLEADVMDAAPAFAALGTRKSVILEAEDGDIDMVVGEIVAGDTARSPISSPPSARNSQRKNSWSPLRLGSGSRCAGFVPWPLSSVDLLSFYPTPVAASCAPVSSASCRRAWTPRQSVECSIVACTDIRVNTASGWLSAAHELSGFCSTRYVR